MGEVLLKTHLIVTDVHEEYNVRWIGKVLDTKPQFKNGKPVFVIVGSGGRMELNTTDMLRLEKCAKMLTRPKGREAVTTDSSRIFIKEEDDNEKLLCVVTHNHVKSFAPMYDKIEVR
jgi:hypothetical protein